ncbi:MAG: sensor histidine kinase [Bryobacteraceae bacterium]
MEVQEFERRRLARELHDDLGQRVTALLMELSRIDAGSDVANVARLARAREYTEGILHTIRDISSMLRPALLDDLGLKAALEGHIRKFYERTGLPCTLICSLREPDDLPDSIRTCVYRVIQEALNNCEKHASASSIHVTIERADPVKMAGELSVTIADDGCGLPPGALVPGGSGLSNMRERVELLHGTFTIESSNKKGTAILLTIPVDPAKQSISPDASF